MGSIGSMMKGSEHYKKVQMQLSCFQKRLFQGHCVDIVNKLMAAVLSSESDKNGNEMYIDGEMETIDDVPIDLDDATYIGKIHDMYKGINF